MPYPGFDIAAMPLKCEAPRDAAAWREGHRRFQQRAAGPDVPDAQPPQGLERAGQSADDLESRSAATVSDAFLHVWPTTTLRLGEWPASSAFAVRSAKKSPAWVRISSAAQLRDLLDFSPLFSGLVAHRRREPRNCDLRLP